MRAQQIWMSIDPGGTDMTEGNRFDALLASLDPAVVVVTTTDGRELGGCLVSFHSQAGISPRSLALWLSKANHTVRVGAFAEHFAVHLLASDQMDLAELFATETDDSVHKFERCGWSPSQDGVPLLDDCPRRIVGTKRAMVDLGEDHVCLVLEPVLGEGDADFTPMRRSDVADLVAGHDATERPVPRSLRSN